MFKPLRKKGVVRFIMWAVVIAFVGLGAGNIAMSRKGNAGVLFGKKISMQDYNRAYSAVLNRAKMMYGDNLSKFEKFLNLKNQAWDRLILKYSAKRKRIKATNKEVVEKIASLPLFQRDGIFDERLYSYIVTNVFRSSPRDFEESIRTDIIIEKMIGQITDDISLTEDEIYEAYKAANEQADISYIIVRSDEYRGRVAVTEDEIRTLYENNRNKFKSPALMNVEYIRMPFGDDKEEARFSIEEIDRELKQGKDFAAVSKDYALKIKETGDFSLNSKIPDIGLSYPFAITALELSINEISDTVETADSFCIMRLKSKKEPAIVSFEEAFADAKKCW